MTSTHPSEREPRIRGRDELVQAIPYLLEYRPVESLVLVGMAAGRLVVTARIDLADVELGGMLLLDDTVSAAVRGGARDFVAVVFTERDDPPPLLGERCCYAGAEVAWAVHDAVDRCGASLTDAVLVRAGRCWSYLCDGPCCPADGTPLSGAPSPFVARATVEGTVVLPDRAARTATIDPLPADQRAQLLRPLAEAENAARAAREAGRRQWQERSAKRALFAALRACREPGWTAPPPAQLARLAVALTTKATRDSIWYAIEDRRLDGRPFSPSWPAGARRRTTCPRCSCTAGPAGGQATRCWPGTPRRWPWPPTPGASRRRPCTRPCSTASTRTAWPACVRPAGDVVDERLEPPRLRERRRAG